MLMQLQVIRKHHEKPDITYPTHQKKPIKVQLLIFHIIGERFFSRNIQNNNHWKNDTKIKYKVHVKQWKPFCKKKKKNTITSLKLGLDVFTYLIQKGNEYSLIQSFLIHYLIMTETNLENAHLQKGHEMNIKFKTFAKVYKV